PEAGGGLQNGRRLRPLPAVHTGLRHCRRRDRLLPGGDPGGPGLCGYQPAAAGGPAAHGLRDSRRGLSHPPADHPTHCGECHPPRHQAQGGRRNRLFEAGRAAGPLAGHGDGRRRGLRPGSCPREGLH
ncbi:DUF4830 domain-containing protein, partial [Dysosmobacter welbionis]